MSGLINQAVESFSQVPDGLEHPLQTAAVLGGTAVVMTLEQVSYHFSREKHAAAFSNPALLEKSVQPNIKSAWRSRMSLALGETAGAGLILLNVFGGPTYSTTSPDRNANTVVVEDASYSMLYTADLGSADTTRHQATVDAIRTVDYEGSISVVQAAADSGVALPLGRYKTAPEASLIKPVVNPNGANLVGGMERGASLFPPTTSQETDANRTEVIVADGVIENSAEEIAAETAKLQKEGIDVRFVIVGTPEGHYSLPNSPVSVSSSVETDRFSDVPGELVTQAKTVAEVEKAIHEDVHTAGTTHHTHKWLLPGVLGVFLAGAGFIADKYQRIRRIV